MHHLIANSGIQFLKHEVQLNPDNPFEDRLTHQPVKVTCGESVDLFSGCRKFSFLCKAGNEYIPVEELFVRPEGLELSPAGTFIYGSNGLPLVSSDIQKMYYTTFVPGKNTDDQISYSFQTLNSYQVLETPMTHNRTAAFNLLLDKWLPIPLFEKSDGNLTDPYPTGWCRVKISLKHKNPKGDNTYFLIWAIDTALSDDPLLLNRPFFSETDGNSKDFGICNRTEQLSDFFFTTTVNLNGEETSELTPEAVYISNLLNIDLNKNTDELGKYQFLGYYAFLINFLRNVAPLDIKLNRRPLNQWVPVDMVLDIGNSRTCGVLFENGDLSKRAMLKLRDLTDPSVVYDKPFDMRIVFRRPDFGKDISNDAEEPLFEWNSLVRIGEEAKHLIYKSAETQGLADATTNYSSPKRYLWDSMKFKGCWSNLSVETDPLANRTSDIYSRGITDWLNEDGSLKEEKKPVITNGCHYSRKSLMMLAFCEIFNHAICQINSPEFRTDHGSIDLPRYLRSVIITAPTAISNLEQTSMRQLAKDALRLVREALGNTIPAVEVVPSPDRIKVRPAYESEVENEWLYDEATACQLVYLYAELKEKYNGDIQNLFESRGHKRDDLSREGVTDNPSLTICSIDIGAGTTDVMVCAYTIDGTQTVRPYPLFWDSFYLAGDDILSNIVKCIILDGKKRGDKVRGSIFSVLEARLLERDNEYFRERLADAQTAGKSAYIRILDDILRAQGPSERQELITSYARNLLIDYFGVNSANNNFQDRRCRADFNTQISVPIAQLMMEQKRLNRPATVFTYDEIFSEYRPSQYLLVHFRNHFGFGIEEIEWEYEPRTVSDEILKTVKPLMRQLDLLMYKFKIDILMLAGRPTSVSDLPDIFLDFLPVSPDRIVRLDQYNVGSWYPFATGEGFIYDQKTVVAIGGYIGYLASRGKIHDFKLDLTDLGRRMRPTSNYIGKYVYGSHRVDPIFLSPTQSTYSLKISTFPFFLGCKQLKGIGYEGRPMYAVSAANVSLRGCPPYTVMLQRQFGENPEAVEIVDVLDSEGNSMGNDITIVQQSMVDTDTGLARFWLDDGAFKFL